MPPVDFEQFYAASWSRLLRSTYAVTRDEQRAEDAVQAAFAKAYASWSKVARADDPLAYVRRMAFHEALSQGRLAFRRREASVDVLPETASDDGDRHTHRLDLWDAIGLLPPRQRAVVVLRYYEDLTEQQTADTLGVRVGTVKSQASAAMAALRRRLGTCADPTVQEEHR